MDLKMNAKERPDEPVQPGKGEQGISGKAPEGSAEARKGQKKMSGSYYGNHGASTTLNTMIGWLVGGGSAEDDIDLNGATLRKRARDLYAGGGLARSGPNTLTTNVVGWGISPKPKIDGELLNMSDEARDEWEKNALREFKLWAESPMCDAERQQNFFGLQWLAFLSALLIYSQR